MQHPNKPSASSLLAAPKNKSSFAQVTTPSKLTKQSLSWLHSARFFTSCAQLNQLPPGVLPEIAFVGRSNAGKSTCINLLTQQKGLAFTSKIPGRTQHINLFALGKKEEPDAVLADLPGYGYAAVPKLEKHRWQEVMANYLVSRRNLRGVVLLCDARRGLTELDNLLLNLLLPRVEFGLPFLILLTKADKLNRSENSKILQITRLQAAGGTVQLFSSLKRQGIESASETLWEWAHPDGGATITATNTNTNTTSPKTDNQPLSQSQPQP